MEKTSKLTTKKLIIILASVFVVCGIALGAIVFARNAVHKVASDETYTYVNPDETKAEADTGFKIDGVFDEEPYQKNNWLYLHREEGESVVDIASTSYYGDKGLYFAFEVTESTPIYVNLNRASYLNSCVELYFAPNGVKDMNTNDIFEVDMLPTGDLIFKQRNTKSGWTDVTTKKDTMAYLGATTKGGDVNTKDCYGYNLELFIPWDYLEWLGIDVDSMKKDFVHANMAHITSFNHEGTDINIDRYWYSFATQLGGNGFTDVEEYFKFDETGALGTVPITLVQGEHYTISGAKTVIPGLKASITVVPEEGYALNSILVNESEWIQKVSYNKDGSVTFLVKGVKEGLTVSASAEPITKGNKTLSGTVYMNKITGDSLDGVSISYTGPQGEKPIELDANGRFTLNGLKQGYYTIFVEKEGYTKLVRKICLNRDIDTELTLEYDLFDKEGSNAWDIDEQNDGVLWKKNRKSATILTKEQYGKFSFEANFRYDESLAKLSDDDLYTQQRSGLRIKFSNEKYWHVDVLYNGENYVVQYAKFTGDNSVFDWTQVYVLSQKEIAAYKSEEGIKLKVVRDGQYGNVYLGDKLIAIENLGKEFKNCTANVGFELFVANQEFLKIDFDLSTNNIKVIKDGIFARGGSWDISKQFEGVITLINGGRGDLRFAKDYENMDLTLWVKDDPKGTESEKQSPRTDVKFEFSEGKFISFSVLRVSDDQVMVQSMGGDKSITGWKGWYDLSAEEMAQYNSEKGVAFRIVRLGTEFSVYIGDKLVAYKDFAGDIGENEKASVTIGHWGDEGVDLDFPIQVTEKIDLVNIVNVGNGKAKVVTKKKNHFVGDTVVLTGEGGYYCYEMKVDGQPVVLNQDGTYSFKATKKDYTVEGTFAERIFVDNEDWNTLAQKDGLVYLPNGGGENSPLQFYKKYADVDLSIIAKNDPNGVEKEEQSPRTDIQFKFEDGKFVSFGVLRVSDEQVMIQSIGGNDSLTGWKGWYNLTKNEREQYNSEEGVEFRVVRLGTDFSLFIGDKMVRHLDLSGDIEENTKATVYLRHWGDQGVKLDFPFEVTEKVDKVAKIGNKYYNTLEAAVAAAKDGDTVVLLKDVTVNGAMEAAKKITITNEKNVTITRGEALTTGGQTMNVPASGNVTILGAKDTTFTIDGGSTEATSSRFAWVAGTLQLENVTVQNFNSTAEGAVVYNEGIVNFVQSTVIDNASTKNAAVLYNKGTADFVKSVVSNNESTNSNSHGGVVWNEKGTVTTTNTTFSDNSCAGNGGVIGGSWNGGTIIINGGKFTGNEAASGGVICGWSPTTITINENPTFSNNKATGSEGGGAIRTVGAVTLKINGGTFSENSASNGGAIHNAGQLEIAEATFTQNTATSFGGVIWNDKGTVTTTNTTFSDNSSTGNGGVIAGSWNGGTIIINGGSFTGNQAASGGAICGWGPTSITINENPTFSNNTVTGTEGGGAIRTAGAATLKINGGTFSKNSASNGSGGAIYVDNASAVIRVDSDVNFEGNTAKTHGGAIYTKAALTVGACTFGDNQINITGNDITITPNSYQTETPIVTKASENVTDKEFAAVTRLIQVTPDSNGGRWLIDENGYLTKATVTLSSNSKDYFTLGEAFADRNTTKDTITLHKNVTWDRLVEGTGKLTITNTADVTITRSSDLIAAKKQMISFGGTLTIEGIEGTKITLDGASTEATDTRMAWTNGTLNFENVEVKNFKSTFEGAIVYNAGTVNFTSSNVNNNSSTADGAVVYNAGTVHFKDSVVENNSSNGSGGVVRNANNGVLNCTNSTFNNNTSSSNGGVVASGKWSGGTITITGGSFTNNTAAEGGVICGWTSTITVNGSPTFSNNKAKTGHGGAIRTVGTSKLTINGGTFSENSAPNNFGGAIFNEGQLTITDATFTQNTAKSHGGAIWNHGSATTTITNSTFNNNTSTNGNGGVIGAGWNGGTITINGGSFTNNTAESGGAICVWGPATFTINDSPTFSNNKATKEVGGGAIRTVGAVTFTINGGTFSENKAPNGNGGAIYIDNAGAVTKIASGVSFTGNTAKSYGGAIYTGAAIAVGSCTFENNQVNTAGKEITIRPNKYQEGTQVVTKVTDTVTDAEFAAVIAKIAVEPDANTGEWLVNAEGRLVKAVAGLASTGKNYASLGEAFAVRNTTEDTITLYRNATWDRIIEGTGKLTITNTGNVTITRSSDLIAAKKQMISFGGTLTIEGIEGTKITLDGASTEATDTRMAWTNGTLNFENVEVKNFKSTFEGAIVYNAGTVNFTSSNVNNNSSTADGAVVYNAGTVHFKDSVVENNSSNGSGGVVRNANNGVLNCTNSTFNNNTSSSNGGVVASGKWSGGTITITGGNFTNNTAAEGGVICGWTSTITVNGNPTFSNNKAKTGHGGAIRTVGTSKLTINGGTFSKNTANSHGGAIYNTGQLTITGAAFSENSAPNNFAGAIFNEGQLTITDATFTKNTAKSSGGAIWNHNGATTTITNSTFNNNTSSNGNGGVIGAGWSGGTITINGGSFTNNTAESGGAICVWGPATFTINDSPTFSNNKATKEVGGGAIRTVGAVTFTINGGTFSENKAPNGKGGAIYNEGTLTYAEAVVTFSNNTANNTNDIFNSGTINKK